MPRVYKPRDGTKRNILQERCWVEGSWGTRSLPESLFAHTKDGGGGGGSCVKCPNGCPMVVPYPKLELCGITIVQWKAVPPLSLLWYCTRAPRAHYIVSVYRERQTELSRPLHHRAYYACCFAIYSSQQVLLAAWMFPSSTPLSSCTL